MINNLSIAAVMPLKLNNERLPHKNTKLLGDKPLLRYQLETLSAITVIDNINVFCSDISIKELLPERVNFILRDSYLDLPTSNFSQIFESFISKIDADIYIYDHATAPFISKETIEECINAVAIGNYDSAFCATKIQDFLWSDGKPMNFDASNLPRSQDIKPIYRETSGVYVFKKNVFINLHRRIGNKPYIKNVSYKEAVDINNIDDFRLAEALLNVNTL